MEYTRPPTAQENRAIKVLAAVAKVGIHDGEDKHVRKAWEILGGAKDLPLFRMEAARILGELGYGVACNRTF